MSYRHFQDIRVSDTSTVFDSRNRRKLATIEVYEGDLCGTFYLSDGRTLYWKVEGDLPEIIEGHCAPSEGTMLAQEDKP